MYYEELKRWNQRWNLQKFAEGGDGEGDATGGDGGNSGDDSAGGDSDKKYTDEDVNKILNKKFAEWEKKQAKKISEAEKLANMTAEEQLKALQSELDSMKKDKTRSELASAARGILSESDIQVPDNLIANLIGEDAETTKENVAAFSKAFKAAVQEGVKAALKGKTPPSGGSSTLTKEEIMKVKNLKERQKLIKENMNLFKE
jgi:uncharacterized protein YejL (UPF0352 family)